MQNPRKNLPAEGAGHTRGWDGRVGGGGRALWTLRDTGSYSGWKASHTRQPFDRGPLV